MSNDVDTDVGTDVDVLVIGSGSGGSVTALRPAEKGCRVGAVEAGARLEDADLWWTARRSPRTSE